MDRLEDELASAGPVIPVGDLPAASPERKARGVFARLRERNVPATRILEVVVGVLAAVDEMYVKPAPPYAAGCVGKALKRRGSGSQVIYGFGSRWDHFPASRGRYIAVLGRQAMELCADVTERYLAEVLALKIEKDGALIPPTGPPPFPRTRFGNERVQLPVAAGDIAPDTSLMTVDELEQYAAELKADIKNRGVKAFDGKF